MHYVLEKNAFHGKGRRNEGLSPVIAVVILAAVGSLVAVAYAFSISSWTGGYATSNTLFEKTAITSAYSTHVTKEDGTLGWQIKINLKNTGPKDTTIETVLINQKPLTEFNGAATVTSPLPTQIISGRTGTLTMDIKNEGIFTSGTTIEIRLCTASGQSLFAAINLA